MFCLEDMALVACHNHRIGDLALSRQKMHQCMVLDTITNDRVYELLARSDDYLK